jgi:hypothetical protein
MGGELVRYREATRTGGGGIFRRFIAAGGCMSDYRVGRLHGGRSTTLFHLGCGACLSNAGKIPVWQLRKGVVNAQRIAGYQFKCVAIFHIYLLRSQALARLVEADYLI